MRLDAANRSFLALLAVTVLLAMYVLCGALGSVLVPLAAARISREGLAGLLGGGSSVSMFGFVAIVMLSVALGVRSITRQVAASRRLARLVRAVTLTMPDTLALAAADVGLAGRIALLDAPERFSFVYGLVNPRVVVSRGLVEGVSLGELQAVLEHERYHVLNLDPLKALLAQTLSATFFFLPALESLCGRYLAGRELAADRRAIRMCGPRPLAGALLKVVRGPEWVELEDIAAIGGGAFLNARVAQLETGVEPKPAPATAMRLTLSLAGAALFAASFLASASSLGATPSTADLLSGLLCAAPFAGAGIVASAILARRARRPLAARQTL